MMAGLALLWGFAEATLFFIVPDVLISIVVIRSGWRRGIACALIAALGAAVGGLTMYAFAAHAPDAAQAVVAAVPAIDLVMIERNGAAFAEGGYWAMLRGSFGGVPYKIYAVAAGAQHRAWPLFVLLSPLVRLPRFFLTVLLTAIGDRLAARWLTMRGRLGALIAFWVIFYAIYFVVMPH
jgi:membrane protein YqaA with SNARE-associated domain